MNDNLKMHNNHYSDNELHLMSYQDLRRLSILLQLPANIKKKYMIPMIQAHQKGDGCMKTAIANQIMEERKVKRLNSKKKQTKSVMMGTAVNSQQVPTDLSVSTQHEFETRFSYVAHYSSKDDISSGISRIIKQEAEVSRRNRSVLQQPRKPIRKLSTVGRTEIMLPRNHSLTTPVRLMPQYERGFPPPGEYETITGISNSKNHFQDLNYNYHFHGEFSNSLMPTTTHELYRSEPYWHSREMYNSSLMPILSSLLTPSTVTINSSGYASQYTSANAIKGPTSFQGVYENYLKNNNVIENETFQSSVPNSSTLIMSNHHVISDNANNNYNVSRGSYLITKGDVDFEVTSDTNEINCQHCNKRDETVIKNSNENQGFLMDFYATRNGESTIAQEPPHMTNLRDSPQYEGDCYRTEHGNLNSPAPDDSFESPSVIAYKTADIVETDGSDEETLDPMMDDYESSYTEEGKLWEESEAGLKKIIDQRENFVDALITAQSHAPFESEVSGTSTILSTEPDTNEKSPNRVSKESLNHVPNFSRCRYTLGHNKYPEPVSDSSKITTLPSFLSTFSAHELYNKAYSVCKNSFTGTTETHLNPIMTCTYASPFSTHSNSQQTQVNNIGNGTSFQRQWVYSYPEYQGGFPVDSTTYAAWNEYSNEVDNKIIAQNNNHNVQVVKCRTHGCHYLYSISNPCD